MLLILMMLAQYTELKVLSGYLPLSLLGLIPSYSADDRVLLALYAVLGALDIAFGLGSINFRLTWE